MNHLEVLREVEARGLRLTVSGTALRLQGPPQRATAELVGPIKAVKAELIEYLAAQAEANRRRPNKHRPNKHSRPSRGAARLPADPAPARLPDRPRRLGRDRQRGQPRLPRDRRLLGSRRAGGGAALGGGPARHAAHPVHRRRAARSTEPAIDVRIGRLDLRGRAGRAAAGPADRLREERSHRVLPADRAPLLAAESRCWPTTGCGCTSGTTAWSWTASACSCSSATGGAPTPAADPTGRPARRRRDESVVRGLRRLAGGDARRGRPRSAPAPTGWTGSTTCRRIPRCRWPPQPGRDHPAPVRPVRRPAGRRPPGRRLQAARPAPGSPRPSC